jgi:hypothetical protein
MTPPGRSISETCACIIGHLSEARIDGAALWRLERSFDAKNLVIVAMTKKGLTEKIGACVEIPK